MSMGGRHIYYITEQINSFFYGKDLMETPFDYDEGVGEIRGSRRFVVTGFLQICLGVVSLTAGLVSGLLNWHPNYQGIELFDRLFVGVWAGLVSLPSINCMTYPVGCEWRLVSSHIPGLSVLNFP